MTPHYWSFLSNHALVLLTIWRQPSITIRAIGQQVGITERAVHNIVQALVAAGYVTIRRNGRHNEYLVHEDRPLRRTTQRSIGQLLAALGSLRPQQEATMRSEEPSAS